VIAPSGEVLAATELFTEASLVGSIRLRQQATPFTRYGGAISAAGAAFLILHVLGLAAARRRPSGPGGRRP
jgi:apolipoprotein N-acyltransferase